MSGNTFGNILKLTSWGESHGESIGGVIDGMPSNVEISEEKIAETMARRKPGQGIGTSARNESDRVEILSGIFEGKTTGTPISFIIKNEDAKSKDYSKIKDLFRPGHADYGYFKKYGHRDYRGGGRASARETAVRVAAGAIVKHIIPSVEIGGALIQIGDLKIDRSNWNAGEINKNGFFCPDFNMVSKWQELIEKVKMGGDSIGAMVEITVKNVEAGLGEPVFNKLDAELAKAIMSINAVKSVEIGEGINVANMRGSQNCDAITMDKGCVKFKSNNSGGILGGISTGQDIVIRFAVKSTSSIVIEQDTVTTSFENTKVSTGGRHDACIGIRAVPVGEAMVSLVLADYFLMNKRFK